MMVCDGLCGIENALTDTFPMADLQLCTVHLKRNIANKVKPRDKRQVMEELKRICAPDQWDITPEKAFENFKNFILRWQKSYPPLKRYQHERYRLYFTYFKYEKEIRGMIYTTNWIERLNRDYKRVISMRGAMPNPQAVILLMGTVARDYPINCVNGKLTGFESYT